MKCRTQGRGDGRGRYAALKPVQLDDSSVVVGGTTWMFCREEPLISSICWWWRRRGRCRLPICWWTRCARSILLVGDQQQLAQPSQADHPGDSGQSCLEFWMQGDAVVLDDRGCSCPPAGGWSQASPRW